MALFCRAAKPCFMLYSLHSAWVVFTFSPQHLAKSLFMQKMGSVYAPTPTFVIEPIYYKSPFKMQKRPPRKPIDGPPHKAPAPDSKGEKSPQKLPHTGNPCGLSLYCFFGRCPPLKNSPINSNGCEAQKPRTQCNGKKNSEENLLACGFPQAKSPKRIDD